MHPTQLALLKANYTIIKACQVISQKFNILKRKNACNASYRQHRIMAGVC